eukprot:485195-Pleurochrysis_carterae.AAC.3
MACERLSASRRANAQRKKHSHVGWQTTSSGGAEAREADVEQRLGLARASASKQRQVLTRARKVRARACAVSHLRRRLAEPGGDLVQDGEEGADAAVGHDARCAARAALEVAQKVLAARVALAPQLGRRQLRRARATHTPKGPSLVRGAGASGRTLRQDGCMLASY